MEQELTMLKKQVAMMGGVNKSVSNMPDKTIQRASDDLNNNNAVPKRDDARINSVSSKILSEAELAVHVKTVFANVEKIIPPNEKSEAQKIYTATKLEYKSANALNSSASACWMYGHQAKAIWIIGKACVDFPGNPDLLDNYASFLTMTGAEQAAIPILLYLNNRFANNSTVLNNLGQAWFGLGDIASAKKYLEAATDLYPTHSMANLTLSKIYLTGPHRDPTKAIAALKNSIKESYCGDKEGSLTELGGNLTLSDLPDFNYPVEKNPFQFENLFSAIPDYQTNVNEYAGSESIWLGFIDAIRNAVEQAKIEEEKATSEEQIFIKKLTDDLPYQRSILFTYHNSPSNHLAKRYLLALAAEDAAAASTSSLNSVKRTLFPVSMWLPSNTPPGRQKKPLSLQAMLKILDNLTKKELIEPLEQLEVKRKKDIAALSVDDDQQRCKAVNEINNSFLSNANSIHSAWKKKFYQKYVELENPFDQFMSIAGYAVETATVRDRNIDDLVTEAFINKVDPKYSQKIGKEPYVHRPLFSIFLSSVTRLMEHRVSEDRCEDPANEKISPKPTQLPQTKQPDCPNKHTIELLGIKINFEWGRTVFDQSKLKKLDNGETKGSAVSSKQSPSNSHVSLEEILGHGPFVIGNKSEENLFSGPLISEVPDDIDTTRRYVEFDKYGNFSDFKIP